MKTVFYVQFVPDTVNGRVRRVRATKMTSNPPQWPRGAVVKFVADLPEAAFEPVIAEVAVPFTAIEVPAAVEEPA